MVFVKEGVVLPLGAGGDFDETRAYDSTITKHNGRFFLYYSAYDGSNYRVGLAISKDGISFVKKGVVLPLGAGGDFDETRAYCPTITKHNGRFFLYYRGRGDLGHRMGLAISKDGISFVKKGVVLPLGASGDFDDAVIHNCTIIKHNGRFFLYYSAYDGSKIRMGLAISKDGISFVKKGVVLPLGAVDDFDDSSLYYCTITKHNGRFFLYYSGFNSPNYRIGLAISKDGISFVKKGVVLLPGSINDFDKTRAYYPYIVKHNGRFFLYYSGYVSPNYRIGLAISEDGL